MNRFPDGDPIVSSPVEADPRDVRLDREALDDVRSPPGQRLPSIDPDSDPDSDANTDPDSDPNQDPA